MGQMARENAKSKDTRDAATNSKKRKPELINFRTNFFSFVYLQRTLKNCNLFVMF